MVILNYNDAELTAEYVRVIQTYNCVNQIVVVDNHSSDGSFEMLVPLQSDKVDVIQTEKNDGYASGNNYGVKFACNRYEGITHIIISNPDIEIEEASIEKILATFHSRPNQFAVTGAVYSTDKSKDYYSGWNLPNGMMIFLYPCHFLKSISSRIRAAFRRHSKNGVVTREVYKETEVLTGCFFIADREKWDILGGFCEKTYLGMEENILFHYCKKHGFVNGVVIDAPLVHYSGHSIQKCKKEKPAKKNQWFSGYDVYLSDCLGMSRQVVILFRIWYYIHHKKESVIDTIRYRGHNLKNRVWKE